MTATPVAPRKPERRKRQRVIATRLLPEEERRVEAVAEREGKSISELLRDLVLAHADDVLPA